MKRLKLILAALIISTGTFAQTGIGTTTPEVSAQLDVSSTTKGFLAPRMTEIQRLAITGPATGLLVYQINTSDYPAGYYYYNGSAWAQIGDGASKWTTIGSDIYYNSGNVGIGTTTPYSKLEVHDKIIAGDITSTEGSTLLEMRYGQATGNSINTLGSMYSSAAWLLGNGMRPKSGSSGYISTTTVNFERTGMELGSDEFKILYAPAQTTGIGSDITDLTTPFYIDLANGNVGIGTTNPGHKLTVEGVGTSNTGVVGIDVTGNTTFTWASTAMAPNLTAGNNLIHILGKEESEYNSGYIGFNYQGSGSSNNFLTFGLHTHDNLLNLTGAGNVGIGTTTPRYPLEVKDETAYDISGTYSNDYMRFNVGTTAGSAPEAATDGNGQHDASIFAQGSIMTAGHFKAISDRRVKTDIASVTNSLELLQMLRPVTYKMKDQLKNGSRTHYGFIAQEVEKVLPEAVNTGLGDVPVLKPFDQVNFEDGVEYTLLVKNGDVIKKQIYTTADERPEGEIIVESKTIHDFKSLTYDMIFTLAVDAIQEQQAQIDDLNQKVEELTKLIETIQDK